MSTAAESFETLALERVDAHVLIVRPVQPHDQHMRIDPFERECLERRRGRAHIASQVKPSPLRLIRPTEGEGKCAVQHSVSVSQ